MRVAINTAGAEDGRHRRSSDSRRRIVTAMLTLIRDGNVSPKPPQVAAQAGVGLRTVFRHFEDMESLYREMAEQTAARILPVLLQPYRATGWRERLDELVERRQLIYEDILPLKNAASLVRYRSAFIMEDHRQHLLLERRTLQAILPDTILRDAVLSHALEMSVSFQSWSQLRQEQKLSVTQARRTLGRLIRSLVPD